MRLIAELFANFSTLPRARKVVNSTRSSEHVRSSAFRSSYLPSGSNKVCKKQKKSLPPPSRPLSPHFYALNRLFLSVSSPSFFHSFYEAFFAPFFATTFEVSARRAESAFDTAGGGLAVSKIRDEIRDRRVTWLGGVFVCRKL